MRLPFLGPLFALALATPANADVYTFETLDVPGALPSYFGTQAFGINNAGQVVGSYTGTTSIRGFVFDQTSATYTSFDDPTSIGGTIAQGINGAGLVVGTLPLLTADRVFLRDPVNGTFTHLTSPPNQVDPTATGINDAGQIVGYYTDGNVFAPAVTSFVRDPVTAAYTPLQDPNSSNSSMPNFTVANGINNAGQVVGFFQNMTSAYNGFLFSPLSGIYTTLSYPTATNTFVEGINNSGQVVGYYFDDQTSGSFVFDIATGVYTPITDPNGLATFAEGINDAGQIVGYFTGFDGIRNAFLATPSASTDVPEPASLALLGVGVFGLGLARHWRRKTG